MTLRTSCLVLAASAVLASIGCSSPTTVVDSGGHDASADARDSGGNDVVTNDVVTSDVVTSDVATNDVVTSDGPTDAAPEASFDAGGDVATTDSSPPVDVARDAPSDALTSDVVMNDVAIPDGGCAHCIASPLTWGTSGGFTAFNDGSELDACATFVGRRMTASGTTTLMCSNDVPTCTTASSVDMPQVLAALASPEVMAALTANAMYGRIIPDVGTFRITYMGNTIAFLPGTCTGTPGCVSPPTAVAHLRTLLESLTMQQIALAPCATTFPSGF